MVTPLERTIKRNLMTAALVERAIYERDGWTVRFGGVEHPAHVVVSDTALSIWATLVASEDVSDDKVTILHNGDAVAVRALPEMIRLHAGGDRFDFEVVFNAVAPAASVS